MRRGRMRICRRGVTECDVEAPALAFLPRGGSPDAEVRVEGGDAECVRASVDMGGTSNPVALALPEVVTIALRSTPSLEPVARLLMDEALSPRCGGQAVLDRLCEILVIRLLRHLIEEGSAEAGVIAGLAHPSLSRAIVAIHDRPDKPWRLEDLAEVSGMSRTHFANSFRDVVGVTPGEYLSGWRLTLARLQLSGGAPLKTVVRRVGFSSSAALSRAFKRRYGMPPREATAAQV